MREIKFRVWNKKDKKMYHIDDKHLLILANKKKWSFGEPSWDWEIENETDETDGILMQYTGLKDVNGKEIYEGDIVEYPYGSTKTCKEVEWQDDTSGFYPFADSPENCGCCGLGKNPKFVEVIGNIYENPELLGENK